MRAEVTQISTLTAAVAHVLCFAGLAAAHALAGRGTLVSDPALALRLLVVCEAPIVIAAFSYLRRECVIQRAARYWIVTIYWLLLMSLFTHVSLEHPIFDWQNVLSHSIYFMPTDVENYMISAPCHGAVVGRWLGAWPMSLDWESLWQEWPICVTYGAVARYLVGMAVSLVLIAIHKRRVRAKAD